MPTIFVKDTEDVLSRVDEQTFAHLYFFEDGKVRRIRQYRSRAKALEAAGLRE